MLEGRASVYFERTERRVTRFSAHAESHDWRLSSLRPAVAPTMPSQTL